LPEQLDPHPQLSVLTLSSGRTQLQPTGLLVGEFWEDQLVGERDIDLDQRSTLLER
jgi:hypothetical protein